MSKWLVKLIPVTGKIGQEKVSQHWLAWRLSSQACQMSFSQAKNTAKAVLDLSLALFKNSGRIKEISGRREKTGMFIFSKEEWVGARNW